MIYCWVTKRDGGNEIGRDVIEIRIEIEMI